LAAVVVERLHQEQGTTVPAVNLSTGEVLD